MNLSEENISMQRSSGVIIAKFAGTDQKIKKLYQQGASRFLIPKNFNKIQECVYVNTSGGITGGDKFSFDFEADEGSEILISTQAAEKAYEAKDQDAFIENKFKIKNGSKTYWLPQEMILFSKSSVSRETTIEIFDRSEFLGFDQIVLGRQAMGEILGKSYFLDKWKIYYNDKLVYFDQFGWKREVPRGLSALNDIQSFANFYYIGEKSEYYLKRLREYKTIKADTFLGTSLRSDCLLARVFSKKAKDVRNISRDLIESVWQLKVPEAWNF